MDCIFVAWIISCYSVTITVLQMIVLRVLGLGGAPAAPGGVIDRIAFSPILWEAPLALFGRTSAAASSQMSWTDTGRPPSSSSSEESSSDSLLLASDSLSPSSVDAKGVLAWSWNNLGDCSGGGKRKK